MNYSETLDWMFSKLPMYQRQGKSAFKKDLTNTLAFSKHLNHPEKNFKSIHVGGTNGKGSTSHMLASILQQAGYKVGLYTSPHLKDFRERIKINGIEIDETEVVNFIETHKEFLSNQQLSFFEMTVGMAFHYFSKNKVDVAVIEVGLGGRLDSTNIIIPEVAVITNIGLDHTQFLGETLQEIAGEKAGIIKESIPVVIGEYHEDTFPVFNKTALSKNAPLYLAKNSDINYELDLMGIYQVKNSNTALEAIKILNKRGFTISNSDIEIGFKSVIKSTGLKGRWQILKSTPKVICDTAHNAEGLTIVLQQLMKETFEKLHIVLGVVNDKNLAKVLPLFPKNANYYFCKPDIPRGLDVYELQQTCRNYGLIGDAYSSVNEAYNKALKEASKNDLIFIGGSTFVVAEIV